MNSAASPRSRAGLTAVGIFLLFGSITAFLAGTSLICKGTPLDQMWRLNPPAYQQLAPIGKFMGTAFLILSALLALAALGWFKRRLWGWWLAVAVIAIQILGDSANLLRGHFLEGAAGVVIAGTLLFYLLRPQTHAAFCSQRNKIPLDGS
jgi:hypothetical protein